MKTINNFLITNKKVLLRVDFNVPVKNGLIIDNTKINLIKPTIEKLISKNNKIFIVSHFGRPEGKFIKKYSLNFICKILEKEFDLKKVFFSNTVEKKELNTIEKQMSNGDICLIENIRYYEEEESNDYNFAKELASNFDIYINDAFSASHRNHASIVQITNFLPSLAGYSFLNELTNLDNFLLNQKKPVTAIIGGAKVSTKISLLENLIECCDNIVIGGAMANTFLFSQKYEMGISLVEKDLTNIALDILKKAKNFNCKICLPIDVVCSNTILNSKKITHCDIKEILPNQMVLDIGDKTIKIIKEIIINSNMILWNGPLGAFENKPFDYATNEIANIISKNSKVLKIISIAGGGDTLAAIKKANAENGFTYISVAGGAFIEWFEGKESPGLKALKANTIS